MRRLRIWWPTNLRLIMTYVMTSWPTEPCCCLVSPLHSMQCAAVIMTVIARLHPLHLTNVEHWTKWLSTTTLRPSQQAQFYVRAGASAPLSPKIPEPYPPMFGYSSSAVLKPSVTQEACLEGGSCWFSSFGLCFEGDDYKRSSTFLYCPPPYFRLEPPLQAKQLGRETTLMLLSSTPTIAMALIRSTHRSRCYLQ